MECFLAFESLITKHLETPISYQYSIAHAALCQSFGLFMSLSVNVPLLVNPRAPDTAGVCAVAGVGLFKADSSASQQTQNVPLMFPFGYFWEPNKNVLGTFFVDSFFF